MNPTIPIPAIKMTDMNIPDAGVAHNLTLVSFEKTFSGQAQKVMNSLWGAGQMMFNKVLVVVDKEVDIQNNTAYPALHDIQLPDR